jgi:hypothetical protein
MSNTVLLSHVIATQSIWVESKRAKAQMFLYTLGHVHTEKKFTFGTITNTCGIWFGETKQQMLTISLHLIGKEKKYTHIIKYKEVGIF